MKQLFVTLMMLCCILGNAQQRVSFITAPMQIEGIVKEDIENPELNSGTPFTLLRFAKIESDAGFNYQAVVVANGQQVGIPLQSVSSLQFTKKDPTSFWLASQIESGLISYYNRKGLQEAERKEMSLDASAYLGELEKAGLIYHDEVLEDYIHCIMLSMLPQQLVAERYGMPYVRLLKSPNPDALMLANNCLLVSTGLLTTLDTEEELFGILSREIAHYVLDHGLITVNKNINRVRWSVFWGAVADGITTAGERAMMYRFDNYVPGALFATNDLVQFLINTNINKQMGLDYSRSQEKETDKIATDFMKMMKKDPYALVSAMGKIQKYYKETQDGTVFKRYGIYGTLDDRLEKLQAQYPEKELPEDRIYLKSTASVVSYMAGMMEYNNDYTLSMLLAQKNIDNQMTSPEDYVVIAQCIMKQSNTAESNQYCDTLLDQAEALYQGPTLQTNKQRILLLMRTNKQKEAAEKTKHYLNQLKEFNEQPHTEADALWLSEEYNWANRLLQQLYIP